MSRNRMVWLIVGAASMTVLLWFADAAIRALISGGSVMRLLLVPPGDAILTRISLLAVSVLAAGTVDGIRRLRVARQEAVEERRHVMLLYENTTDAIVFLDRDLAVIYANPAAERICGKRFAQTVGWPCYQAFLGLDAPCAGCKAREVFETGEPRSAVKHEFTATGIENWLDQRWFAVPGKGGEVEAVLEVARDITDLKLLEREVAACRKPGNDRRRAEREALREGEGAA